MPLVYILFIVIIFYLFSEVITKSVNFINTMIRNIFSSKVVEKQVNNYDELKSRYDNLLADNIQQIAYKTSVIEQYKKLSHDYDNLVGEYNSILEESKNVGQLALTNKRLEEQVRQSEKQTKHWIEESIRLNNSRDRTAENLSNKNNLIEKLQNENTLLKDFNSSLIEEVDELRKLTEDNVPLNPPIIEGNRYIYIYTDDDKEMNLKYKVGETRRSPYDRIKEQDSTSNSDELKIIAYFHSPWASDEEVHKLLPNRIRKCREWFILSDPIEQVKHAIISVSSKKLMEHNHPLIKF